MDFKLLKLNLKIGWLKLTGKLQKISDGNNFPSISIDSPHILIVLPIDKQLIPKSMNCISSIVDLYKDRDAQFSFIINNKIENKINFYNIRTLMLEIGKNGDINNSKKILDKIYFEKYDMVIDLNTEFYFDLAKFINQLNSNLKIGFKSIYSDYFYNIQIDIGKDGIAENGFNKIQKILIS